MSWQTWFFLIVGIPAVLVFLASATGAVVSKGNNESAVVASVFAFAALLLALIVFGFGAFAVVGTRQVGIETTFNRPTGKTFDNGLHWKKPWSQVTEMDGAIQIDKYDTDGHRIKVRLGDNSTAEADTSIRWQLKPGAADVLFVQYKTFDNVRVNLVERNLQVALNEQFQDFDPLASKWADGVPLQSFADKAADHLRRLVGEQVDILDIAVSRLDYADRTEERIATLNVERANTSIAEQAEKTAAAQRRANEILATSVSNDPNVIVANCITKALDKNISPWGCWPGQGAVPTVGVPGR